jgi:hypothetical protein
MCTINHIIIFILLAEILCHSAVYEIEASSTQTYNVSVFRMNINQKQNEVNRLRNDNSHNMKNVHDL